MDGVPDKFDNGSSAWSWWWKRQDYSWFMRCCRSCCFLSSSSLGLVNHPLHTSTDFIDILSSRSRWIRCLSFDFFSPLEQGYLSFSQAMKIPSYQIISSVVIGTFDSSDVVQTLRLILFFIRIRMEKKTSKDPFVTSLDSYTSPFFLLEEANREQREKVLTKKRRPEARKLIRDESSWYIFFFLQSENVIFIFAHHSVF